MVKFSIDGKWYSIPTRFTPGEWVDLARLDLENPVQWPLALHRATGAPLIDLQQADPAGLQLGMGFLMHQLGQRKRVQGHKDFTQITWGEWVDLDIWLVWGVENHLVEILTILYPDCEDHREALWVVEQYAKWRSSVYKSYSSLFGLNDPAGDDEGRVDKLQVARGWYHLMVKLAGGDILKLDPVAGQPLKQALNLLAYMKQEELEERAKQLQIQRKYDIQRNSRSARSYR